MNPENKSVFVKRSKSFAWRLGMMIIAAVVGFTLDNLGLLELSPAVVTVLGLVLGEVSKYLATNLKKE